MRHPNAFRQTETSRLDGFVCLNQIENGAFVIIRGTLAVSVLHFKHTQTYRTLRGTDIYTHTRTMITRRMRPDSVCVQVQALWGEGLCVVTFTMIK